jgi:CHAT domain-containing protein
MVLSACDLGASAAVSAGEGLGAVTALIAAGVRTVIASSLLVPDHEVVGDVMVAFHRELRTGTRAAAALAAARRTLDQGHPLAPVLGALQCHGRW